MKTFSKDVCGYVELFGGEQSAYMGSWYLIKIKEILL